MFSQGPSIVILPGYVRGPMRPSRGRQAFVLAAQLLAAAVYGVAAVFLPIEMIFVLAVPIVICLLVVLWIMPDRAVFPITAIEKSYRILLIFMVIWPTYLAVALPGLPWLTPTRIMLFVVTILFCYSLATSAQLRGYLLAVAMQVRLFWIGFLMWQASMLLSLPLSAHPATSVKMLIDRQLGYTESLFLGCLVFYRRGMATWTIGCVLILAVICAVDGFIELKMGHPPWTLYIPSFMRVDEVFLANVLGAQARSGDGLYRVRGQYSNSLIFAEFLALCMPFILHWMLTGRSIGIRSAMPFVMGLLLAAIIVTQSRLGLIGTIVAVATYVPLWAFRQWRANPTSILGPTLLFGAPLIAFGLIAVVFSSHRLSQSVLGGGAQEASNQGRTDQRKASIPLVLSNPIGYGLGEGGRKLNFRAPDGTLSMDDNYMATTLDLGVLGVIGYYGIFVAAAWAAVKCYLAADDRESELAGPLASMFIIFLVVRYVLAEEDNHPLVLLFVGMAMALRARNSKLTAGYVLGSRR